MKLSDGFPSKVGAGEAAGKHIRFGHLLMPGLTRHGAKIDRGDEASSFGGTLRAAILDSPAGR